MVRSPVIGVGLPVGGARQRGWGGAAHQRGPGRSSRTQLQETSGVSQCMCATVYSCATACVRACDTNYCPPGLLTRTAGNALNELRRHTSLVPLGLTYLPTYLPTCSRALQVFERYIFLSIIGCQDTLLYDWAPYDWHGRVGHCNHSGYLQLFDSYKIR